MFMKYFKLKFLLIFAALAMAIPPAWAETVTVTKTVNDLATEYEWTVSAGTDIGTLATSFGLDENINISTTGNPNCGSIWGSTSYDWRLYQAQNGNVIITAVNGCTLKSVKLVYNISKTGTLIGAASNTDIDVTGTSVTYTVGNTGNATNGQVRITSFSVTYEKPAAGSTYTRVTDATQLGDGKSVILVYENGESSYAMGAIQSSNSRGAGIPIVVANNKVTITDEEVTEFTFKGIASSCFLAISDGQYLAYSASGKFGTTATASPSSWGKESWKTSSSNGGLYITSNYESGYGIRLYTGSNQFAPFKSGSDYKEAILYVKEEAIAPVEKVATPTFSVATGTYTEAQSVEISCETEGATIYYTTDGADPTTESTEYTAPISISTTTTLKAIAVKDGMDNSAVATATYTFTTVVTNLAAANALDPGTDFVYNGYAVVTYVVDNNTYGNADIWIRDDQGNAAYLYRGKPTGLAKGDVLQSGWTGSRADYNGLKELTNVTLTKSVTAEVAPELVTEIKAEDVSKYVRLENVSEVAGWYDKFGTGKTLDATKTYNVEGIVGIYNTLQFWPITVEEIEAPVTELEITLTPAEASATAGEDINVTVTANVEDVLYEYTVNPTSATLTETETGFTLTSATAGEVTVSVYGTDGNLEKTVTGTYTFNEPAAPLASEFVLVTNVNQLAEGKQIIFVSTNSVNPYADAMSSQQRSNNRGVVTVAVAEDKTVTLSETSATYSTEIFTLEKEGDYWLFKANKTPGYIYAAGGTSNNYLKTSENKLETAKATISIDDKAIVTFNVEGSGARNLLSYNSSNSPAVYSCYKAEQKPVYIYVEKSTEPIVEPELTVTLTPAEAEGYTVGDNVTVYATVENGSEDTMVTYKINNGEEQDYTEAGIILPNTAAGDVVVTVYALDGDNEATDTVSYHFNAAEAFAITLTPDGSDEYTVGDKVNVKVAVENNIGDYIITYSIDRTEENYDPEKGIDIPNDRAGDVTLTVNVADGYAHQGTSSTTATYHFNAAPDIVVTLNPSSGTYYLDEQVTVTVATENTIGDALITYQIGDSEPMDYENGITITAQEAGTINLTVTVADGYHEGVATATGEYVFAVRPVAAAPEFSLVSGSYGTAQTLEITSADGATIYYTTDGTEPTTASTQYTGAIELGEGKTIVKAIAVKDGMTNSAVANAYYIIDIPEEVPALAGGAIKGYFAIKNNGNDKYANIQGRKTMTFTNAIDKQAGTVIWVETNEKGQVQSLRSQAADLQGYADRAMRYVPELVELAVNKLHAEGAGNILGEHGLDSIMAKFNKCFDHHLYVEDAEGGYRIYGKTPSMQHVVDFYREHTYQVEAKLPRLEEFINETIDKILEKTGGRGQSILQHFSLHETWERMGGTLTEPVDSASTMTFYREVLNDKNYVWDFAYETAMTYWERLKSNQTFIDNQDKLGEFAQYLDMIEQVRPDFKYYIVQENDKPDYISEGNGDIIHNEGRTIWTLEPRSTFVVNFSEENQFGCPNGGGVGGYATTLYTDFAYNVPEGVTAYKVAAIKNGVATLKALTGTIPAQSPVLLVAKTAGDFTLELSTANVAKLTGNMLVGVDSLITRFELKTPQVVSLFNLVKTIFGENFYNNNVLDYEYLMLLYAGTVNNKYFWGLSNDDVQQCVYINENNKKSCVIRNLVGGEFVNNWESPKTNQAFLVSQENATITIASKGDVNHDGLIDIADVTMLIHSVLTGHGSACEYCGDMDSDGSLTIADVTTLINLCLKQGAVLVPDNGGK